MARREHYYNDITILKAIATCFITWFHFKFGAPDFFKFLFIGGAIGNSLFFFASGYLLMFKKEDYIGQWLLKKYLRVIPSVWCGYLLFAICNYFRNSPNAIHLQRWFYPTSFWFINSILLYFLLVYIFSPLIDVQNKKNSSKRWLILLCCGALILNVIWYFAEGVHNDIVADAGGFSCWYYFAFFLWGYYVRNYNDSVVPSWMGYLNAIVSVVLFFVYKKLAVNFSLFVELQSICIPLLLAYVLFSYRQLSKTIILYNSPMWLKKFFCFLSEHTLEIYIVQVYFIHWLMPKIQFPLNILAILILILVLAWFLKKVTDSIPVTKLLSPKDV